MERDSEICSFVLVEAQTYQVAMGTARISKDQGGISGDSFRSLICRMARS